MKCTVTCTFIIHAVVAGQAIGHGPQVGLKDKMAAVLRSAFALIDADADGFLSRDELRVYSTKVLLQNIELSTMHQTTFCCVALLRRCKLDCNSI